MSGKGRKPKPTKLKLLEGNPGKRPLNNQQPQPKRKVPTAPKWLDDVARKEWGRLAKPLFNMGLLTEVDGAAFEAYCVIYSRYVKFSQLAAVDVDEGIMYRQYKAQSAEDKNKYVFIQKPSYASMASKYLKELTVMMARFGLTPSDRTRIVVIPPEDDSDPLLKILD